MLSFLPLSYLVGVCGRSLLSLDLAIVLDGDLVVRLECGDSVVGDLGAVMVLARYF
jgi:hypothetical protein